MLFLIPAYLSEESQIDYFAPSIKEYILKPIIFSWKTKNSQKSHQIFAPEKKTK